MKNFIQASFLKAMAGFSQKIFHIKFYHSKQSTWMNTHWMGQHIQKNPMDLWSYQELIWETKPDLIIECGTNRGGSALFFANLLDLIGGGRIITIDTVKYPGTRQHPRIEYINLSSTSPECLDLVKSKLRSNDRVMVILDSDHSERHVTRELELYPDLVTKGQYLIVEDTNVNGHPVFRSHGPGPMEALEKFLRTDSRFEVDEHRERFMLTFFPKGWLRRVR